MDINTLLVIFIGIASIFIGAILGALCVKYIGSTEKNNMYIYFYAASIIALIAVLISICIDRAELLKPNWVGLIITIISIISIIGFMVFTKIYLTVKSIYQVDELNPIINSFTKNADKTEIRLFGGDLDFFGIAPDSMDAHPQYTCLRSAGFTNIHILCTEPRHSTDRIRYGKILSELKGVQLKFYKPATADLGIRGRMKELQKVTKLLIYTKISDGIYQAIETDTANTHGKLYDNIWKLLWSSARELTSDQIEEYKSVFNK